MLIIINWIGKILNLSLKKKIKLAKYDKLNLKIIFDIELKLDWLQIE